MPDVKPVRWRWILHDGTRYEDIGISPDGSLRNPNGYPEDIVRAAIEGAEERKRQRRSDGAKKAAATRARRRERKVADIVALLRAGKALTPAHVCRICRKPLGDPESVGRGIGSDCWQDILAELEKIDA